MLTVTSDLAGLVGSEHPLGRRPLMPHRGVDGRRLIGWDTCRMIRLVAVDRDVVLDERQVQRIIFWLSEVLPASRCQVHRGPGVAIVVEDRDPADLVKALRRRLEDVVGCALADGL